MKISCSKLKHFKASKNALRAMTLVEVVVALAVTGLAIGGVINGYNFCTSSAQKAALAQVAVARAMERIEETRSVRWDLSTWPQVDQLVSSNFPAKNVMLDMSGSGVGIIAASLQTDIAQIATNPPLKRIRVNCVWRFQGGPFITNSIETFRAPDQ